MPKFVYRGVDAQGKSCSGMVEADTEADALSEVGAKGLFVEEMRQANVTDELRMRWQDAQRLREQRLVQRHDQLRQRHARQRLVVRYRDGKLLRGMCYALNVKDSGFHLDVVDDQGVTSGKTVPVSFADLKAVFHVKSFDGHFDKTVRYRQWTPEGSELVVEFADGEVLRGLSLQAFDPRAQRFYVVPNDPKSNNVGVLVEMAAVKRVYSPEEYEKKRAEEASATTSAEGTTDLSQEETLGDFYFETRNYAGAMEQYQKAQKRAPQSQRLRRKLLACEYNIGVQFIKSRKYAEALERMESIVKVDPGNPHARKKVLQLRRILEREKRRPTTLEEQPLDELDAP